ncbi:MAG: 2-C-methyl-D-erythritol 4-phosphate cytidylyltransferase [Patescibacteria group bacterium]
MIFVIIVAAGKGKRMKAGKNKVFLEVVGKPMIYWTILNFEQNSEIDGILLVTAKNDISKLRKIVDKYRFKKILNVIVGGKERQDSSFAALKGLKKIGAKNNDLVLIHNGANPLVDKKTISDVIFATKKRGAAVCGFQAQDTIKESRSGSVKKTLDREKLWQIQTPQGARFGIFWKAFLKAKADKFLGTDDAVLVERLGRQVKIVKSPVDNIKVTYPEDLEFVKNKLKLNLAS